MPRSAGHYFLHNFSLVSTFFALPLCYPLLKGGENMTQEYKLLFNGITQIIAELQNLQCAAEEAYLSRLEKEDEENFITIKRAEFYKRLNFKKVNS